MKTFGNLLIINLLFILSGCSSLYNVRAVDIEIFVPAQVYFPAEIKTLAVRYNNSNVAYNPLFAEYILNNSVFRDTKNSDSLASEIYYAQFLKTLKEQNFFDAVVEIEKGKYTDIYLSDTLVKNKSLRGNLNDFVGLITMYQAGSSKKRKVLKIDPEFGLYSRDDLIRIADSTKADMLLSLDFFTVYDTHYGERVQTNSLSSNILIIPYWNFIDLNKFQVSYYFDRIDTISWETGAKTPWRDKAISIAAEISGANFTKFLTPHWMGVQRIYYRSNHVELVKTDKLISEGKWLEAAKIWKANVDNPNQKIAAKSMFNMAVACEIEGRLDAALDWAIRSYHVFGSENEVHAYHCMDYIKILTQRNLDIKRIERQLNPITGTHL
jgi:hypothetical protein